MFPWFFKLKFCYGLGKYHDIDEYKLKCGNLTYEWITIMLHKEDILSWSLRFYEGGCECLYMAVAGFS